MYKWTGAFKLYKTNDIFKYAPLGRMTPFSYMSSFRPVIDFKDILGTYIGNNLFVINQSNTPFTGDVFVVNDPE